MTGCRGAGRHDRTALTGTQFRLFCERDGRRPTEARLCCLKQLPETLGGFRLAGVWTWTIGLTGQRPPMGHSERRCPGVWWWLVHLGGASGIALGTTSGSPPLSLVAIGASRDAHAAAGTRSGKWSAADATSLLRGQRQTVTSPLGRPRHARRRRVS